ncbi:MAG: histone family protein [Candidatus Hodarchaeales archaeon]|jgi:histone H3/H4
MTLPEIPLGAIDRLMRKAGVQRISLTATESLRDALEQISVQVAEKALECAKHSGRVTLGEEDILLALKLLELNQ